MVRAAVHLSRGADLKSVVDSVSNIILAVDRYGVIIYCNRQVEKLLDIPAEQIIGRPVTDYFPNTGLLEVLETGRPQLGRKLSIKNCVYLTNRNPVVVDGQLVGAVAVFQDVTEIQNIIDELTTRNEQVQELQETLANILELSSDGIVVVDRNYIITMTNQAFANFFNKKVADLIGRHVRDIYNNPIFPRSMETGESEFGYMTSLNGHEIIANRVPLIKNGVITGAIGTVVFKNISDLYALSEKIKNLHSQLDYYKNELERVHRSKYTFDQIIGGCPSFKFLKETARRVANSHSTVLIRGESGTGKELFAHALHTESLRSRGPFIKVNCAAVPESLLESELFGYVEGAFTGAKKGGQMGKFELAHKGVIFLDEIGDMSLTMQSKLLRVLQEKEIERLGDSRPRQVDVRVIAATNRNLEEMIARHEFREDLYYRINVVTLTIPPLRERIEDLNLLLDFFIQRFNSQFGQRVAGIDAEVMTIFRSHHWPGNVRELENVVERAFNLLDGNKIEKKHLPLYLQKFPKHSKYNGGVLPHMVEEMERDAIMDALSACGGNKAQAASMLGISRSGLYKKLDRYNIRA